MRKVWFCMKWALAAAPAVALLVVVAGVVDAGLDAKLASMDRGGWFHLDGGRSRVGSGPLNGHARLPDLMDVRLDAPTSRTTLAQGVAANQSRASAGSIQALEGFATTSHPAGSVSMALGTIGHAEHAGSGILRVARGVTGGAGLSGEGGVERAVALFAEPVFRLGTGEVGEAVGLYIARQDVGVANYAMVAEMQSSIFALVDAGTSPDGGAWILVKIGQDHFLLNGTRVPSGGGS